MILKMPTHSERIRPTSSSRSVSFSSSNMSNTKLAELDHIDPQHELPLTDAPASISKYNVARRFQKRSLLVAINCIAGLSIFFFGYDQGMMGGVNNAKDYIDRMGFGYTKDVNGDPTPVVTDSLLQGGIVSVYYLGTLVGCLIGGWVGEKIGRIRTIAVGAAVAVVGATLQCSAMNSDWMICARLVNGWGTGILNSIVPVWATETADHSSRGQFIAIEFTLNSGWLGVS